jgi:hypothetical protein
MSCLSCPGRMFAGFQCLQKDYCAVVYRFEAHNDDAYPLTN